MVPPAPPISPPPPRGTALPVQAVEQCHQLPQARVPPPPLGVVSVRVEPCLRGRLDPWAKGELDCPVFVALDKT